MISSALKSKEILSQLCFSLSELVSLLKCLRTGWGPPLDLLVRMVNSNFWLMEADLWADLLIVARWSNPTIKREDVLCILCSGVWEQPVTTFCDHTFCRRCLMEELESSKDCPECGKVVDLEKVKKVNKLAETLLSIYKTERHVSDEEWDTFCNSAKFHSPLPHNSGSVSCDLPVHKPSEFYNSVYNNMISKTEYCYH